MDKWEIRGCSRIAMKKVIGIVGEGPTDYMVIKEVIDYITGETNEYRRLQPEPDMAGRLGHGW